MESRILAITGYGEEPLETFVDKVRDASGKASMFGSTLAFQPRLYSCKDCHNTDQGLFHHIYKDGSVVCFCGIVAEDRVIFDGDPTRNFKDDLGPSKSQFGSAPIKGYSSSRNLSTIFLRDDFQTRKSGGFAKLVETQHRANMGLRTEQEHSTTRESYKDKMKEAAFREIDQYGEQIGLNSELLGRAKLLFADYRDSVEKLRNKKAVISACIVAAHRADLSNGERKRKRTFTELHQFGCTTCDCRFNCRADQRFHKKECEGGL